MSRMQETLVAGGRLLGAVEFRVMKQLEGVSTSPKPKPAPCPGPRGFPGWLLSRSLPPAGRIQAQEFRGSPLARGNVPAWDLGVWRPVNGEMGTAGWHLHHHTLA